MDAIESSRDVNGLLRLDRHAVRPCLSAAQIPLHRIPCDYLGHWPPGRADSQCLVGVWQIQRKNTPVSASRAWRGPCVLLFGERGRKWPMNALRTGALCVMSVLVAATAFATLTEDDVKRLNE